MFSSSVVRQFLLAPEPSDVARERLRDLSFEKKVGLGLGETFRRGKTVSGSFRELQDLPDGLRFSHHCRTTIDLFR